MGHKISIIIPMYNSEEFLADCLDSIIQQSYENLEIICIDDASTDSTLGIAREFLKIDKRIKILECEKNMGQGHVRNLGIKASQGDFIGFVDSDDVIDKNYYSELYKNIIKHQCDIASGNIIYKITNHYQQGDWPKYRPTKYNGYLIDLKEKILAVYANCNTSACKHLFNRNFIISNDISFLLGVYHEDQYFIAKAFIRANKISISSASSPNYIYKIRNGSSINQSEKSENHKKLYFDQLTVFDKIISLFEIEDVSDELKILIKQDFEEMLMTSLEKINIIYLNEYITKISVIIKNKIFLKRIKKLQLFRNLRILNECNKLKKRINDLKQLINSWT